MNMVFRRKLPIPKDIKEMYPLTDETAAIKSQRDVQIKDIFAGKSDKLLLVVGPCSADAEAPVLDYVGRLARLQEKVADKMVFVPRVYTNKPRTVGQGYMGMLHQPDPKGEPDLLKGIVAIRSLHMKVLSETGLSTADEMLYPESHRYLSDLLSYVAVGARSVEDQHHRLVASGLDIPCGMKNPTGGDLSVMLNSVEAAQHPHAFIYRGWEVVSKGNPYAHAILRGYVDKQGKSLPNYEREHLEGLYEAYLARGLQLPAVVVDTNHANSGKQWEKQLDIAREVVQLRRDVTHLGKFIKGLMIESYLEDGAQSVGGGVYGKSITDPCLGWEKTERLVLELAEQI